MTPHTPSTERATPIAAILLIFLVGFIFSLLDTSAKYLVLSGMSAPFIVWVRFAVHVVLVLILFRSWSDRSLFQAKSVPLQLLRGVFLFGSTIFNFIALKTLPLADVMTIFFVAPMVITAIAGPLLGEWAGWRRWVAVGIGFIGVLVVTRPGSGVFEVGHVYALVAMLSYCFYVIMTRQLGASETASSMIFFSALAPVIFMSPAVPLGASMPPTWFHMAILLSLGFYGLISHWLLIKAYKLAPASALAPYPYLQMVWAVTLGYVVFGDIPDRYTMIGAAIIVASGLYIVNRERQLRLASRSVPHGEEAELAKKL